MKLIAKVNLKNVLNRIFKQILYQKIFCLNIFLFLGGYINNI